LNKTWFFKGMMPFRHVNCSHLHSFNKPTKSTTPVTDHGLSEAANLQLTLWIYTQMLDNVTEKAELYKKAKQRTNSFHSKGLYLSMNYWQQPSEYCKRDLLSYKKNRKSQTKT